MSRIALHRYCAAGLIASAFASAPVFAQNPSQPAGDAVPSAAEQIAPATPGPRTATSSNAYVKIAGADWPAYGGAFDATRYSNLDQITPDNVGKLKPIWTFHTGDLPDKQSKGKYSPETTPIKIGHALYLCSAMDQIIALDAKTGKERWRYDPKVPEDAIPYGATCRGVSYYKVPDAGADTACATRIVEGTMDSRLIEVDAETGQLCSDFGRKGMVFLDEGMGRTVPGWYGINVAPTIVRGVIVVGGQVKDGQAEDAPSGVIRGYDAVTGKLRWAWDMGHPDRHGSPPPGESYTRGTPNMWSTAVGDDALGLVYVPLGNSSVDYWGGNRKDFENQFNSSLVAIDVTTGRPAWHFQTVHYDVWDYDLGSQPTLVDFPTDHGTVPAIILSSKQGEIYVLDRRTGKSLFPVKKKPVPKGGVEADRLSPEQPFSGYATLAKPRLEGRDMWGMSPLDQLWCRIQFRMAAYDGEFTPPTADKRYIEYPGYNGGSDWGSLAVDAKDGIVVANYNDMPNYNQLVPRKQYDRNPENAPIDAPGGSGENSPQIGAPYGIDVNAGWQESWTGLMCKQPPYGGIRAIELKTGKTLWDRPFGEARQNGPWGIPSQLPLVIGTPNNGGSVITAGGLIFIAAATDNLMHAIDLKTGKTLWTAPLPAGGQANPMVYEEDGKEYVVIMAGGHHFMHTGVGDAVIAYGLPKSS